VSLSRTVFLLLVIFLSSCGHRSGLVPEVPPTATLEQYAQIINAQSASTHVPAGLIGAIIAVESGGNARATNPSGSMGLMQLKRATAAHYGVTDLYDPAANITAGAHYLRDLIARFHGNIRFAVAAYKTGPAAVEAAHGIPPGADNYVDRVMRVYDDVVQSTSPSR
jgi:soluble lytic murein transglycosylase-like protein